MRVSSSATFQRCPEIHRYGSDLNLYFGINDTVGEKDRCGNQHMITAVTALFRIFHIITSCKDRQVILFGNHICDQIDIRCKGTADTDSCDVIYIAYHVLDTGFISMSFQFFYNAFRSFDSGFYMFDWIVFMSVLKFTVEYQSLFLPV